VIVKLLIYNQDNRMTAGQALKHACFKEFREADKTMMQGDPLANVPNS
jgi:cellobiose-specific phosphotransferase system component IIA